MLKIYTFLSNRPDLLALQYHSFEKHLKEPFEFIVVNNAVEFPNAQNIEKECRRLGLQSISVQVNKKLIAHCESLGDGPVFTGPDSTGNYKNTNTGCGYSVAWAWENAISKQSGPICIIHHDMFLIRDVKLTDYLKDQSLAFVPQNKPGVPLHMWEGFVLADISKLPEPEKIDWWCGYINEVHVDVGGQSHHWFVAHPEVKYFSINPDHTEDTPDVDFHPSRFEYMTFNGEPIVLHYRAASNWMNMSEEYHERKLVWLKRQLQ